jgi:YceI-like domain
MSDDSTIVDAHAGDDLSSPAGEWEADPTHSALEFVARYAMFTLVRARFTLFSGAVVIDPASPETTQIAVDIDASSVDSATAWRDTHLRGEECFVIERHSSITVRLGVRRARRGALRGGGRADDPRSHPAGATRRRPVRSNAGRGRQPWARLSGDSEAAAGAVGDHVERAGTGGRRRPG